MAAANQQRLGLVQRASQEGRASCDIEGKDVLLNAERCTVSNMTVHTSFAMNFACKHSYLDLIRDFLILFAGSQ